MPICAIRKTLKDAGLANACGCEHPGLALNRYVETQVTEGEWEDRRKLYEQVIKHGPDDLYRAAFERWQRSLNDLGAKCEKFRVCDRLIVGLGGESVLETGITLHHTYGVPLIPGSALKGLARHYYLNTVKPALRNQGKEQVEETEKVLFGEPEDAAFVTYFDALYVPGSARGGPLPLDVITVHHPKYYQTQGENPPTDFDDPNPVPFLSAVGDYLVALKGPTPEWTEYAFRLLESALSDYGVGGKTSSGYGRLKRLAASPVAGSKTGPQVGAKSSPLLDKVISMTNVAGQVDPLGQQWVKLPEGEEKAKLARAIHEKLKSAGLLKSGKWKQKDWVKALIQYLSQKP